MLFRLTNGHEANIKIQKTGAEVPFSAKVAPRF
jgi:hypothetical protein